MTNCKYYYHRPTGFLGLDTDEGCTRFGANSRIPFDDAVNYNNDYCSTTVDAFLTCPLSVPQTVVEITRMPGSGLCERCSYYVIRNPLAPGGICTYATVAKTASDGCIVGKSIAT